MPTRPAARRSSDWILDHAEKVMGSVCVRFRRHGGRPAHMRDRVGAGAYMGKGFLVGVIKRDGANAGQIEPTAAEVSQALTGIGCLGD